MSTQEIKKGTLDAIGGIIKTPLAIPGIIVLLLWKWLQLTPDEVTRIKELQPMLNSAIGVSIAFSVVIAALVIALSYVFMMLGKFKEEIKDVFTTPLKDMTIAISALNTKIDVATDAFEAQIERGERQRAEIEAKTDKILSFIDSR